MASWGAVGVCCCLGAYGFYLISRSAERAEEVLRSITRVNGLKDLAHLLDTGSKLVSVVAKVGSDTPLDCERSQLRGVILEETVNVVFMKRTDSGHWTQNSETVFSRTKEVPWYLDDGTGRIYLVGFRDAIGFRLTLASEVFETGLSLLTVAADCLQDLKILGLKRAERILPIGTSFTVIGEAVKDQFGKIRIKSPQKGPFYVTRTSIDELIEQLVCEARWTHYVSVRLMVFGVCLLAIPLIKFIKDRRRRRLDMKKRFGHLLLLRKVFFWQRK